MVSWDEPAQTGGSPLLKYRIFVNEKESQGSTINIDTTDNKTQYRIRTPPKMHGKDFTVQVQAINRD